MSDGAKHGFARHFYSPTCIDHNQANHWSERMKTRPRAPQSVAVIPSPPQPAYHSYREIYCASWEAFLTEFKEALPDANAFKRYLFRGQSDANWTLRSTFDRAFGSKRVGRRDKIAKEMLREFYEECARYSEWRYTETDPRVLAMAQHHGLPTRLLDWSFSPYVAAYFAFSAVNQLSNPTSGNSIAIWALNREHVQERAPTGQLEIISIPDHDNVRMGNQYGAFTYLKTNDACLEEYLTSTAVGLNDSLLKFTIPQTAWQSAIQDLMFMGIHHGTIFPGREGVAKAIMLRHMLAGHLMSN